MMINDRMIWGPSNEKHYIDELAKGTYGGFVQKTPKQILRLWIRHAQNRIEWKTFEFDKHAALELIEYAKDRVRGL